MSLLRQMQNQGGKDTRSPGRDKERRSRRRRRAVSDKRTGDNYSDIKQRIQNRLLCELDPFMDISRKDEIRRTIQELFNAILSEENMLLSKTERERLFESIVADILGLGPLEPLLDDDNVTAIMVIGAKSVFVERNGTISLSGVIFESDEHVLRAFDRMLAPSGMAIASDGPLIHTRLADGSTVTIVTSPISRTGPSCYFHKLPRDPVSWQFLHRRGWLNTTMINLLRSAYYANATILLAGNQGYKQLMQAFLNENQSGQSVQAIQSWMPLPNAWLWQVGALQPADEVAFVEAIQQHMPGLRMAFDRITPENAGAVRRTMQSCPTLAALQSQPDPAKALRLFHLLMTGATHPVNPAQQRAIISRTVDLLVIVKRFRDRSYRIQSICELQLSVSGQYAPISLFEFEQTGIENNKIVGRFYQTGNLMSSALKNRLQEQFVPLEDTP